MTRVMSTGKNMGSNEFMEKSVNHSKKYLGKKNHKGMDKKSEFTAEEVPNRPVEQSVRALNPAVLHCFNIGRDCACK